MAGKICKYKGNSVFLITNKSLTDNISQLAIWTVIENFVFEVLFTTIRILLILFVSISKTSIVTAHATIRTFIFPV